MNHRLIPILLLLLFTSCGSQEICDDDSQSIFVARFRTLVDGEITDTIVPGISVHGTREGTSFYLLYDSVATGGIAVPLDPSYDRTEFVISTASKTDTLILLHSSEAYLISSNCGFASRFTIEEFTHTGNLIVDMELIKASVDAEYESNEEHIWIYF